MLKERWKNIALWGWLTALGGMVNYVAMAVLCTFMLMYCIIDEQKRNKGIPSLKGLLIDSIGPAISIVVFLLQDWIDAWKIGVIC